MLSLVIMTVLALWTRGNGKDSRKQLERGE
jgi:hypothetical protein